MSDDYSEKLQEVVDDYDEDVFWHGLETRLGKRDFMRTATEAEMEEMEDNDGWYPDRIQGIYDGWSKEFEDHGIDRLEVSGNGVLLGSEFKK